MLFAAGTEDLELSVADRYHGSVLVWHDLSAKEKKTLRGEHVDAVNDHRCDRALRVE
jgi:hypothetical protein